MYIYTATVVSLDIYKALHGLMHVFFMLYCVNFYNFCILDSLMQLLLEMKFQKSIVLLSRNNNNIDNSRPRTISKL